MWAAGCALAQMGVWREAGLRGGEGTRRGELLSQGPQDLREEGVGCCEDRGEGPSRVMVELLVATAQFTSS